MLVLYFNWKIIIKVVRFFVWNFCLICIIIFDLAFHHFWDDRSLVMNLIKTFLSAYRTDAFHSGPQPGYPPSIAIVACVLLLVTCFMLFFQVFVIILSDDGWDFEYFVFNFTRFTLHFAILDDQKTTWGLALATEKRFIRWIFWIRRFNIYLLVVAIILLIIPVMIKITNKYFVTSDLNTNMPPH